MDRRRVAIMGGSFNPIHIGHIIVADYVRQHCGLDEVWLVLSPLNPLKVGASDLIDDGERMEMLRIACRGVEGVKPCDVELTMPRPSYTIDTLNHLSALYPDTDFSLLIGSDNWLLFDRWRSASEIIERYGVRVYPRPGYDAASKPMPANVSLVDAPTIDLSATRLRRMIAEGYDVNLLLPAGVYRYISENGLYCQKLG